MVTKDYSQNVGTTAVTLPIAFAQLPPYTGFMRLSNVAPSGGGVIWYSRAGVAAPNAPGSYQLQPGQTDTVNAATFGYMPTNPVSVVATAAGTPLTVEVG